MASTRRSVALGLVLTSFHATACRPILNIEGTYFPASIVCATLGLVGSYLGVWAMARVPALRPVAQSSVFFLGLASLVGGLSWWTLFRVV